MSNPPGRPTSLTPELQDAIVRDIRRTGAYVETVCQAHGICKKTFYNWKDRGETGEEPFATFLHAIKEAEALSEMDGIAQMKEGGKTWMGAAAWLERRFRQRWHRSDRIEHSGEMTINSRKLEGMEKESLDKIREAVALIEGSK